MSETAHLVGCSCAVVVSIYQKWCMDGETTSRRCIDSRGQEKLLCIVRRDRRATSAEINTSYNSDDPDSVSQHNVQHMGLHSK
ncbi:hypothetical protein X975_03704, partial [Stegodyphus mimosarum]